MCRNVISFSLVFLLRFATETSTTPLPNIEAENPDEVNFGTQGGFIQKYGKKNLIILASRAMLTI